MSDRSEPILAGPLPERVGPYRVETRLGVGGMGIVYRARAPDGAAVALKTLHQAHVNNRALSRFAREASIRVDHPNVIRVLDAGLDPDGIAYIALELLEGESLEARIERQPLTSHALLRFAEEAAAGLAAVHDNGIVHRDLKPANLFCCADGTVKVLDFGIARVARGPQITAEGTVLGSVSYLSPEQARGLLEVDPRTDVWAMGALMYEALAGRAPFDRASPVATVLAIIQDDPQPIDLRVPGVSPALAEIIHRCLEKSPGRRYPDGRALTEALVEARESVLESAAGPVPTRPTGFPRSIPAGEQRVVAVLIARGIRDLVPVERLIAAQGGEAVPFLGQGVAGLFGGRSWMGDEPMRAAMAALDCRVWVDRIAVASGRARTQGTDIAGAAVQAAELRCGTRVEGVAVDPETAKVLGERFVIRPVSEDTLEIVSRKSGSDLPPSIDTRTTPTLGREAEVVRAASVLELTLRRKTPHAIRVTGPLGIGKTRLRVELENVLAQRQVRCIIARGAPTRRGISLSVVGELIAREARRRGHPGGLEEIVREAVPDAERARECIEALDVLVGTIADDVTISIEALRTDPETAADRLRIAMHDVVAGLCATRPAALLVEDLQWADADSIRVLEQVLRTLDGAPVLLFLSSRERVEAVDNGPLGELPGEAIELRGLSKTVVGALASLITHRRLPDRVITTLMERTEGVPFFVEQMALAMMERGDLEKGGDDVPLPLTIEAAVQARLDSLPEAARDLCKRASILERPFLPDEVEALGATSVPSSLELLVHRDILIVQEDGEHAFRSPLLERVTRDVLAPEVRAEVHRLAAEYLDRARGVDPEEPARHWERAGAPGRAAFCYARSALAAARRGDAETLLRCSEQSFALGAPVQMVFELHMARADTLRFLGRRREQADHLGEALRHATTDDRRARVLTEQVAWLYREGRLAEAEVLSREAVETARRTENDETLVLALGEQAEARLLAGHLVDAERSIAEASRLSGDALPRVQGLIASRRGRLATARGDLGTAIDAYRRALALYRQAGAIRRAAAVEQNLADSYNRVGAYADAERALADALATCRRVGQRFAEGYALANLGYACAMQQRASEALEHLADAAAVAKDIGDPRLASFVQLYRARTLLGAHDAAAAAAEADDAASKLESAGLTGVQALALAIAGRALLALGDAPGALERARRAMEIRDSLGGIEEDEAEVFLAFALALDAAGRADEAAGVRSRGRERVEELAGRIHSPVLRERCLRDVDANAALLGEPGS